MNAPTLIGTMVGATGSGKTVFMHALYGTLAARVHGFSLHTYAEDRLDAHQMDHELREIWEDMVGEGLLPGATTIDEPRTYSWLFKHGGTPLLTLDWQDYRGKALTARGGDLEPDVGGLIDRIARSHVLYVALSAEHLTEPVWISENGSGRRSPRYGRVSAQLAAGAINAKINAAQSEQGGLGAGSLIVVLITKADLLDGTRLPDGAGPDQRVEFFRNLTRDVAALLPHAFVEGTTTMVCPVSLGPLRTPHPDKIDPDLVRPRWVYKPLLLPAFHHLASWTGELSSQQDTANRGVSDARTKLAAVEKRSQNFFRQIFVRQKDEDAIAAQRRWLEQQLSAVSNIADRQKAAADLQQAIEEELMTVPVLAGGRSMRPDLDLSVQDIVDA